MTLSEIARQVKPGQWFRREEWWDKRIRFNSWGEIEESANEYSSGIYQEDYAATDWVICDDQEGE